MPVIKLKQFAAATGAFHQQTGLAGMSIEFRINDRLIVVTARGVSTYEEVIGAFVKIVADPAFRAPARVVFDARYTDHAPPSYELEMLAEHLGKTDAFRDSRWAIVAQPISLMYGLVRMFCCFAEFNGLTAEPFSDFGKACAWVLQGDATHPF
jgi:hypothetical protein